MPNCEDGVMHRMKPSRPDRMSSRFLRVAKRSELRQRNDPALPPRQLRQLMVTSSFPVHMDY
jgi:hypothetical protein